MTVIFSPEIVAAIAEVDRLVRPWLMKGDDWRKDADGLPVVEDIVVALSRVRGGRQVRLDVRYQGDFFVADEGSSDTFDGPTLQEALLLMLQDDLRRTCPKCREHDSHDVNCPALAPVVHFSLGGSPPVAPCDAEDHEDDTASPVLSIVTCPACSEWARNNVVVRALPNGTREAFVRVLLRPTGGPSDPVGTIAEAFAARRPGPAEDGDSEGIAFLLPGERLTSAELAQLQRESAARETAASEERA